MGRCKYRIIEVAEIGLRNFQIDLYTILYSLMLRRHGKMLAAKAGRDSAAEYDILEFRQLYIVVGVG